MATLEIHSTADEQLTPEDSTIYNKYFNVTREREFPMLHGTTYLDHAGTTLYPRSLIDQFSKEMLSNLLGNPHSTSAASQWVTNQIEDVRLKTLQFFGASSDDFDLVFVANATAGIKLVMEGFREHPDGFWYGYHKDSHTSVVGVREAATSGHYCFGSDGEVEEWLEKPGPMEVQPKPTALGLFAYPAQSNFNGRRLPLSWTGRVRSSGYAKFKKMYTLLDAAALVSTSPFELHNASASDYTVLSFYKIFGFPDLGALIVRKDSSVPLQHRKYFGGGTVEMVTCLKEQWHMRKNGSIHEQLEDGTLPIHSIIALGIALSGHERIYGSIQRVSSHTSALAKELYDRLSSLRHSSGREVCEIYKDCSSEYGDSRTQGPIIAFSLKDGAGDWISISEVEKVASVKKIQFRSGGLCNPGGIAASLRLDPWEMKRNFSAGQRCGNENDIIGGKPTGVIRVSLGAMSNLQDVTTFVKFIEEFYVDKQDPRGRAVELASSPGKFFIESLSIYPIKSCGDWSIPLNVRWDVRAQGLAWDREWCLVHQGTRRVLNQKNYPKMAMIKPVIDLEKGKLTIRYNGFLPLSVPSEIHVPLSLDPVHFESSENIPASRLCDDTLETYIYTSKQIAAFFTTATGTPCTLARFSPNHPGPLKRDPKAYLQLHPKTASAKSDSMPGAFPIASSFPPRPRPILLSNESPILTISRSSINRLNEDIKATPTGKAVHASAFRANIILAEDPSFPPGTEKPYAEDAWRYMRIISNPSSEQVASPHPRVTYFEILGGCRRCQMVCVDQRTGERGEEPFVTLAKKRRFGGKVFFGVHTALLSDSASASVGVGDQVVPIREGEEDEMGMGELVCVEQ
ncbi:hypothetical protein MMC07_001616 [Pseudocyphellaria aurata]|nr:hypothetical protein [Pseudocyphellaria aurata]